MALFQKGFLKYLRNGSFADIVVICNGKQYKAHRAILAYSSEYFKRLLLSEFKESSEPSITLKFPDPNNVFPELLDFMYTGRVVLTLDNVIPLLSVADHYLVEDLCDLCHNFLSSNIQRDTAIIIIKSALEFHLDAIIDKCITVIAKNFCNIEADYDFFPPHLFLELLRHPYLVVRNEYNLYQLVCHYISTHPDVAGELVEELMGTIRFIWMTYEELGKVEANVLVPRALIIETCMERLKKFEGLAGGLRNTRRPSVSSDMYIGYSSSMMSDDNPRLRPRPPQSHVFVSDYFDNNGIMHYIATQGGNTPWQNPALVGRITILASSLDKGSPHDLLELKPQDMWSRDVPSSWITIDLGPKRAVIPTAYTLRHGMNFRADALRTWDLQGSFNGENWVLCKRHTNDQALNAGGYATHTWKLNPIPPPNASPTSTSTASFSTSTISSALNVHPVSSTPPSPTHPPTPFRYFRILQTGRNSNNHNFLAVNGFEIYGELFEKE